MKPDPDECQEVILPDLVQTLPLQLRNILSGDLSIHESGGPGEVDLADDEMSAKRPDLCDGQQAILLGIIQRLIPSCATAFPGPQPTN
jgi:hypothetical protein